MDINNCIYGNSKVKGFTPPPIIYALDNNPWKMLSLIMNVP